MYIFGIFYWWTEAKQVFKRRNSASHITRLVKIESQFAIVLANELPGLREIERVRRHAFFNLGENIISLLVHTQSNVRANKPIKKNQIIAEQTARNRIFVNRTIRNAGVPIDLEQIAFDLFFLKLLIASRLDQFIRHPLHRQIGLQTRHIDIGYGHGKINGPFFPVVFNNAPHHQSMGFQDRDRHPAGRILHYGKIPRLEFKTCYFYASVVIPGNCPEPFFNLIILQIKFNTVPLQLFDIPRSLDQTEIDNLNIVSHAFNALQKPQRIRVVIPIGKQNGILLTGCHNIMGIIIRNKVARAIVYMIIFDQNTRWHQKHESRRQNRQRFVLHPGNKTRCTNTHPYTEKCISPHKDIFALAGFGIGHIEIEHKPHAHQGKHSKKGSKAFPILTQVVHSTADAERERDQRIVNNLIPAHINIYGAAKICGNPIKKRKLLEKIFDKNIKLKSPGFGAAWKNKVDPVLLTPHKCFEIFPGLGIVHINHGIETRSNKQGEICGKTQRADDNAQKPELGRAPLRSQNEQPDDDSPSQKCGDPDGENNRQKRIEGKPHDHEHLVFERSIFHQIGKKQNENTGNGEQTLKMYTRAKPKKIGNKEQEAIAIVVFVRVIPAQSHPHRQHGNTHRQAINFGFYGIIPKRKREGRAEGSNHTTDKDGELLDSILAVEPGGEQTDSTQIDENDRGNTSRSRQEIYAKSDFPKWQHRKDTPQQGIKRRAGGMGNAQSISSGNKLATVPKCNSRCQCREIDNSRDKKYQTSDDLVALSKSVHKVSTRKYGFSLRKIFGSLNFNIDK